MQAFTDSTSLMHQPERLRERAAKDGYLFLRGFVPAADLEALRQVFLPLLAEAGWIRKDRPLGDAIADQSGFCLEPQPVYLETYRRLYRERAFHALGHHPAIVGFFDRFFGEPTFVHPNAINRTMFPKREAFTTPAHQDYVPIQGTEDTWTVWMPLTDCPEELGGLQVAAGSHCNGVYPMRPALGAGALEIEADLSGRWRGGPFRQGDALLFHSLTPHRSAPNRHPERLRMSVDIRYQRLSDPIAEKTLEPHDSRYIKWEEVYSHWPDADDPLKYYWKQVDLTFNPYDRQWVEARDQSAFQMAEQGDGRARATLDRIFARDPDPAKRDRAQTLLAKLNAAQAQSA